MAEKQFMLKFPGMLPPSLQDLSRLEIEMTPEVAASLAEALGVDSGGGDSGVSFGTIMSVTLPVDAGGFAVSGTPVTILDLNENLTSIFAAPGLDVILAGPSDTPFEFEGVFVFENSSFEPAGSSDPFPIEKKTIVIGSNSYLAITIPSPDLPDGAVSASLVISIRPNITLQYDDDSPSKRGVVLKDRSGDWDDIDTSGYFPVGTTVKIVSANRVSFDFDSVAYSVDGGTPVELEEQLDVGYVFTMPDGDVTVIVSGTATDILA